MHEPVLNLANRVNLVNPASKRSSILQLHNLTVCR